MNKSQQMRWSRRGADLLLQVRCAVYNGTLGSGFGQLFQPHPAKARNWQRPPDPPSCWTLPQDSVLGADQLDDHLDTVLL